jgi:hypothetical protein
VGKGRAKRIIRKSPSFHSQKPPTKDQKKGDGESKHIKNWLQKSISAERGLQEARDRRGRECFFFRFSLVFDVRP